MRTTTSVGWLIDALAFDYYHDELVAAIDRNGYRAVSVNRPDAPYQWDDARNSYRKAFPPGSCVVTHGDIDLVTRVFKDRIWTPGAFASVEKFFCSHYYSHFGKFLLNRDYAMLPFAELPRCQDFLFRTFGVEDTIFVRPDSPLKLFTGMTVSRATFDRDYEFMGFYDFPRESLVVVSSPKRIISEWRFVIVDRRVIAGSIYIENGQKVSRIAKDDKALELAKSVLEIDYQPDPVWVLDVCRTEDHQYHLLEIGGFSFAGLYACDKDAVVTSVSSAALRIHAEKLNLQQ